MKNDLDDAGLRARFELLRKAEATSAPVWNSVSQSQTRKLSERPSARWLVGLTTGAAVAAALLLAGWGGMFPDSPAVPAPALSATLPVLFDTSSQPLFASLDEGGSLPSDFLMAETSDFSLP